jgi:pSer/pThr/pTyr-binding forkhead associated (FHA) protein
MVLQAAARRVTLEVVEGPDTGKRAQATGEFVTIGSGPDNGLVLTDPAVAVQHVELSRCDDGIQVVDLGAPGGIRVGDVRLIKAVVPNGALLRLGSTAVRLALIEGEEDQPLSGTSGQVRSRAVDQGSDIRALVPDEQNQLYDKPYSDARSEVLSEFEVRFLSNLLRKTGGNVSAAAREAQMDRSYLIKLLKKHKRIR